MDEISFQLVLASFVGALIGAVVYKMGAHLLRKLRSQ